MHLSFSLGATYFLQKPIELPTLAETVRKIGRPLPENKRRFTRIPLNTKVNCTVGDAPLSGVTWNISQGGIQIEVVGLKLGDTVRMSMFLPQPAAAIKAQGLVVWAQDGRQGLYFTEMSVQDQEAVRAYILAG